MLEMASGKTVAPFEPRKRDFMGELFQAFNALITAWNARVGSEQKAGSPQKNGVVEVYQPPVPVG
jgi:hypothetical protein